MHRVSKFICKEINKQYYHIILKKNKYNYQSIKLYLFFYKYIIMNYNKFQHGGFLPLGIIGTIGQAFAVVAQLVGTLLYHLTVTLGPLSLQFLKFCVISAFILSIFGFFGIFMTVIGIFIMYYKQIKEVSDETNILRNYSRMSQGLST